MKRSRIDDKLLYAAAHLFAEGYQHKLIGPMLGVDKNLVTKLRELAIESGLLIDRPVSCLTPAQLALAEAHLFQVELRKNLAEFSKRCQAIPVRDLRIHKGPPDPPHTPEGFDLHLSKFGPFAAQRVAELLKSARLVAVTWGITLAMMVRAMATLGGIRLARQTKLRMFPAVGDPLATSIGERSSTAIAATLQQLLLSAHGPHVESLSLARAPVLIPHQLSDEGKRIIKAMNELQPAYQEIFGVMPGQEPSGDGLIDQMDGLLTSVASPEQPLRIYAAEVEELGVVNREELNRLTIGDLGGALLPRDRLNDDDQRTFESILTYWTGARLEHYQKCAERAAEDPSRLGVVVLAIGPNKAQLILECVRRGLITELIIDEHLARTLDALIAHELQQPVAAQASAHHPARQACSRTATRMAFVGANPTTVNGTKRVRRRAR